MPAMVIIGQEKSVGLAVLRAFLFGPLGMLCSTIACVDRVLRRPRSLWRGATARPDSGSETTVHFDNRGPSVESVGEAATTQPGSGSETTVHCEMAIADCEC
jgi:hypothetical protein